MGNRAEDVLIHIVLSDCKHIPNFKSIQGLNKEYFGQAEKVLVLWPVNPRVLWVSWEKGISVPGMAALITTAQTYRKATLDWGTWGRVSSTK